MPGVNELAHEQRVTRHVPHEAAEVLPLRRLSGAEQLGQGVLVGQLVPMAVVFDPESAHEAARLGGEENNVEQRGEGRGERYAPWRTEAPVYTARYLSPLPSP